MTIYPIELKIHTNTANIEEVIKKVSELRHYDIKTCICAEGDYENEDKKIQGLENKVKEIAQKYAEFVEKRLLFVLDKNEVDSLEIGEINDGIRMLNHIAATLERIYRLNHSDNTSGKYKQKG